MILKSCVRDTATHFKDIELTWQLLTLGIWVVWTSSIYLELHSLALGQDQTLRVWRRDTSFDVNLHRLKGPKLTHQLPEGFLLEGGGREGAFAPPLKKFCPLLSQRASSYTARCVFMLLPKISRICDWPPLVTFLK